MVGFGGEDGSGINDLWIFDLQTRRSSLVWEKGEWAPPEARPALIVQGDTLHIIKEQVHSITLHALAELINDDEVRNAFCDALGLPRVPRYKLPPVDLGPPDEVCKFTTSLPCSPRDTLLYKGKILHFSLNGSVLSVSEVILHGRNKNLVTVCAGVKINPGYFGCCLLGDRVLVMSGADRKVSAAPITVDQGRTSEKTVHATALIVAGDVRWTDTPYLCQVSESRALLCIRGSSVYYCEAGGDTLTLHKLATKAPTKWGFDCLPIRLSDGKLLLAGSYPESTDITLITCGEEPRFEKIGDIPGVERSSPSMALVAERFVLGFGGWGSRVPLDDLWIFDLQTRRASIIWEVEEWVDSSNRPVLFLKDERLWILGPTVAAITLSLISQRIDDDEIRKAFCGALGLPPAPAYSLAPPDISGSSGMVKFSGEVAAGSYNTVQHRGKILHFSLEGGELVISEVVFYGQRARVLPVHTGVILGGQHIGCCLLGDRILVMSRQRNTANRGGHRGRNGEGFKMFAALVEVEDGRLSEEIIRVTTLTVRGDKEWPDGSLLFQAGENRALLHYDEQAVMWYCDVADKALTMRKLETQMLTEGGLRTLPIRLPDGKLLALGAFFPFIDVTLISCDEGLQFEKIGDIPGVKGKKASPVLVRNRFVVGFGGCNYGDTDELWIFDLRTRKGSRLRRRGEWHPTAYSAFLALQGDVLCLLGEAVCGISLAALAGLIKKEGLRIAFSWRVGLPVTPPSRFPAKRLAIYSPPRL